MPDRWSEHPVGEADTADLAQQTKTDIEGHIQATLPDLPVGLLKRHEQTGLYTAVPNPGCRG